MPDTLRDAILDFSVAQPPWQQDLLRRLAQHGALTPDDLADATTMCKRAHDLTPDAPAPRPLTAGHLPPPGEEATDAVTLAAVGPLIGVNALLPDQQIAFARSGVTTIFGYNGSGKSGYARVLKRLCRARGGDEPILADVFDPAPPRPHARVSYRVGDDEQDWEGPLDGDEANAPSALAAVNVYDRKSGSAVVTTAQKVEIQPPGLDLLQSLTGALDHVSGTLKAEQQADARAAGFPTLDDPNTAAARFLSGLSKDTTDEAIDQATRWTVADDAALAEVTAEILRLQGADPARRAREIEGQAGRLERLAEALEAAARLLDDAATQRVDAARDTLTAAQTAQRELADQAFGDALPGTGSEPWRALWEAARAFSTQHAYPPPATFPHVDHDAQCVLCQQHLDAPAQDRLQRFEAFVRSDLARRVLEAKAERDMVAAGLEAEVATGLLDGALRGGEGAVDEALPARIDALVAEVVARRDALLARLDTPDPPPLAATHVDTPHVELRAAVEAMRAEVARLRAADAPEALPTKRREKAELEARRLLSGHRAAIVAERERLKRSARRDLAMRACSTTKLSRRLGELTERHVTEALVDAFNRELRTLGGDRLSVALEKGSTRRGKAHTALVLRDAHRNRNLPGAVFSEGEQRAVALAAFFAELSLSPARSAIVFDDPVTSLDHRWREKVAARLVEEATRRQVIVLTHDVVFFVTLGNACAKQRVTNQRLQFECRDWRPGQCSDGLPWIVQGISKRVETLARLYVELVQAEPNESDYESAARSFLERLRETWECAIEEVLFAQTITRLDLEVHKHNLKIVDVTLADYPRINRGMKDCSAWLHHRAPALAAPPPSSDEIRAWVNDLIAWVTVVRERRRAADLNPKLPTLTPLP